MDSRMAVVMGLVVAGFVSTATAQPYVGVDYSSANYKERANDAFGPPVPALDFDQTALRIRAGVPLNRYFALELQGSLGLSSDSQSVVIEYLGVDVDTDIEVKLDTTVSALLKARAPLGDRFAVFAQLGFSRVDLSYDIRASAEDVVETDSDSGSETDISMGLGAEFRMTERLWLNADYLQLLDKSGVEISALNIGLRLDF
jgi:opacity protein-like surface antigen